MEGYPKITTSSNSNPQHVHQYTIAVEEEYIWPETRGQKYPPTGKKVTKLRCVCGAEVGR